MYKTIKRKSDIDAYDAIGKILDDIDVDTEVNYVYFNHLTLLNEQIYLIDFISISQLAKLEFCLEKEKAGSQQLSVLQSDTMIFR
nr:abc transporter b family member 21 [Quercus suber]